MNLECCVVRDLLPSYAEGLCSPQTTALMKTHLAGCEECKAALRAMTSEAPAEQASIISARQANAGLKAAARRFKLGVIAKTCAFVFLGVIMVVCAALGANQLRGAVQRRSRQGRRAFGGRRHKKPAGDRNGPYGAPGAGGHRDRISFVRLWAGRRAGTGKGDAFACGCGADHALQPGKRSADLLFPGGQGLLDTAAGILLERA